MEPSIAIRTPPGLRKKPGWSTFLIAFVTKWYSFLIEFLGRVAWFFNSAGGLVFFEHWPSFFLTFAALWAEAVCLILGSIANIMICRYLRSYKKITEQALYESRKNA